MSRIIIKKRKKEKDFIYFTEIKLCDCDPQKLTIFHQYKTCQYYYYYYYYFFFFTNKDFIYMYICIFTEIE
jgi:hypothetical protein